VKKLTWYGTKQYLCSMPYTSVAGTWNKCSKKYFTKSLLFEHSLLPHIKKNLTHQ